MSGLSISKKLYEILKGDETLNALCQNYFPIVAEETTTFPFIVYKRTELRSVETKAYVIGDDVSFMFTIVTSRYNQGVEIAERIRQLFDKRHDDYFAECLLSSSSEDYQDSYIQELVFMARIPRK